MSYKIRVPKENRAKISFTILSKDQCATEESLDDLKRVIVTIVRDNEYTLNQSEGLAAQTSLR